MSTAGAKWAPVAPGLARDATPDKEISCADPRALDTTTSTGLLTGVSERIRRVASLSELVRLGGIAAVVLSMFMFLVDGISVTNDQQRFYTMLMFTGLLCGAGIGLSWLLREYRGARAFLGLSLVSIPVNFTVLGALVYSLFGIDLVNGDYPTIAFWTAGSVGSLLMTCAIAMVTLSGITFIAFTTMARQSRHWLTVSLLFSSGLLLVPLRLSEWIVPLAAGAIAALIWVVRRYGADTVALKTPTGRFARALLFLPPVIMLVRSLWLYQIDWAGALVLSITGYLALRHLSGRVAKRAFVQNLAAGLSAIVGVIAAVSIEQLVEPLIPVEITGGIFALACLPVLFDMGERMAPSVLRRTLTLSGSALVALASLASLMLALEPLSLILTLSTAALLLWFAVRHRLRLESACATLLIVAAVLLHADQWLAHLMSAGWWGIACAGAGAIIIASLLERQGAVLSLRSRQWLQRYRQTSEHAGD